MPILIDFNQIAISSFMAQMGHREAVKFDAEHVDLLRHIILNSLRAHRVKFHKEFGELMICTDNKSWRKEAFQYYKAHRAGDREESGINWTLIFDTLYDLKRDLEAFFPYHVFSIPGAEADDVIGVLCDYFAENEYTGETALDDGQPQPVLIISGDKDFIQLHKYPNVKQYNPVLKKWLKPKKTATQSLRELIITGDKGDGIPNFRSPDNAIVDGIRQRPIMEKKMVEYLAKTPEEFCESADELKWYRRNEKLIDLTFVPDEVRQAILTKYKTNELNTRKGLLTFFMKHRMRNMIECVGDF